MPNEYHEEFAEAAKTYEEQGFQHRIGIGERPALLHIDLANAWTRPGSPFSCSGIDSIIATCNSLNRVAHARDIPVLYTTTAYDHVAEAGTWLRKIPALAMLRSGSPSIEIDDRLVRRDDDVVIVKKRASAFPGTGLERLLRGMAVDTLIITGVTTSCCVRHTAEDAVALGFRPIVVLDAVGDRIPNSVDYNLFDIDAKFADVMSARDVIERLVDATSVSARSAEPYGS